MQAALSSAPRSVFRSALVAIAALTLGSHRVLAIKAPEPEPLLTPEEFRRLLRRRGLRSCQIPPTPPARPHDDAWHIKRAQDRRDRRALKRAVNARRTLLGKYNTTDAEIRRAHELMEVACGQA